MEEATARAISPQPSQMLRVEQVMELLQVGKSTAYHIMQQCNNDLREQGYITCAGRVSRAYLIERCKLREGKP